MQLSRLFKGTFIYGLGQILSRVVTFFLLPLYTAYLTPEDYGVFGSLAIIGMMMNGLFTLGFGGSLGRKYWTLTDEQERGALIWTSFAVLIINVSFWNTLAFIFSKTLSIALFNVPDYHTYVFLTFFGTSLSASIYPLLTYFRIKEKAVLAISIYMNEVLLAVLGTVYFVVVREKGVEGLVLAGVIAQCCSFMLTLGLAIRMIPRGFHLKYLPELFEVGYPFIFGLFGYFLLQSSSRYLLHWFVDLNAVGLFCIGIYFSRPIEMAVSSFITAWPPFFTSYLHRQEEAKILFGKVFSYYLMGMSVLIVPLFTLAKGITYTMLHPSFYETWNIIGILGLAQSLWGAYIISAAPFLFFKKSLWQVTIELAAGGVCIGANLLLIPLFGKEGAALSTLIGFFAVLGLSLIISRRLLPIQYEKMRIAKILAGFVTVVALSFIPLELGINSMAFMGALTGLYYLYLWSAGLTAEEKQVLWIGLKTRLRNKTYETVNS